MLKMEDMASGTTLVYQAKSYRVSTSLRTGKISQAPKALILNSHETCPGSVFHILTISFMSSITV